MTKTYVLSVGETNDSLISVRAATSFWSRFIGLLLTKDLPRSEGLWIRPCSDVHTWFMRYDIDILFLGKNEQVIGIKGGVPPYRFVLGPKGTKTVLELASGMAKDGGIKVGQILKITSLAGS